MPAAEAAAPLLIRQARESWERERDLASVRRFAWRLLEKRRSGELSAPAEELCRSLLAQSEVLFADGAGTAAVGGAAESRVGELLRRLEREAGQEGGA
ncbi:protein of unknown function [Methylacidimicrobium sp. AP8]|uniref:hypothetical protein n=1 Tax=Methylacidimicrobium sp. AP8 TaxID=2730359 RepID=UPI0018C0B2F6|nr:hypothetical protein [Methylacidimicrobium sp. AP8]CAB4244007.1 protein of unknown function [Methylacidimicrobium sp. AP8]